LLFKKTRTFVDTDLLAFFQFVTVRFTKPLVSCAAMGEMAGNGRIDVAKCRQKTNHV